MRSIGVLFMLFLLAACGQKGALYLEETRVIPTGATAEDDEENESADLESPDTK